MAIDLTLTRRAVVLSGLALGLSAGIVRAREAAIHVVKGPGCECCDAWVEHLRAEGFSVTAEERYGSLLTVYKAEVGVPPQMMSCHTAMADGYVVEGHVPASDIRALLSARPDAIGIAVPGMPYGSPGMGPEDQRDAYDVLLIRRDGSAEVFARYGSKA